MKKIYLFRHGETNWNTSGRLQFGIDTELNEVGIKQAEENAKFLKDRGIKYVYSSKLRRAYKTGEILADLIGVGIDVMEGLGELDGGDYSGMTREAVINIIGQAQYDKFSHTKNEAMDFGYPNGETKKQARNRICNSIYSICRMTPHDTIAIASHGFVIRELLRHYDYEDDSGLSNCEVVEIEFDNGRLKIISRIKNKESKLC